MEELAMQKCCFHQVKKLPPTWQVSSVLLSESFYKLVNDGKTQCIREFGGRYSDNAHIALRLRDTLNQSGCASAVNRLQFTCHKHCALALCFAETTNIESKLL